jgi:hypothetical protein
MTLLADLPNLGPESAVMLAGAGITTLAQLQALGSVVAYARVRAGDPPCQPVAGARCVRE